jgi:hypothetical protein
MPWRLLVVELGARIRKKLMKTVIRRIPQLELIFLRPISFTVVVFSHCRAQRQFPKFSLMRNLHVGPRHACKGRRER